MCTHVYKQHMDQHIHPQETRVLCKFRDKFILVLEENGTFKAAVEPRKLGEPWTDYLSDPRHDVSKKCASFNVHNVSGDVLMGK
jgi:hypothetical protein